MREQRRMPDEARHDGSSKVREPTAEISLVRTNRIGTCQHDRVRTSYEFPDEVSGSHACRLRPKTSIALGCSQSEFNASTVEHLFVSSGGYSYHSLATF